MKKFLTVLLVIAVMFTFSFGSAFAANDATTISDATAAMGKLTDAYNTAVGELDRQLAIAKAQQHTGITNADWNQACQDAYEAVKSALDNQMAAAYQEFGVQENEARKAGVGIKGYDYASAAPAQPDGYVYFATAIAKIDLTQITTVSTWSGTAFQNINADKASYKSLLTKTMDQIKNYKIDQFAKDDKIDFTINGATVTKSSYEWAVIAQNDALAYLSTFKDGSNNNVAIGTVTPQNPEVTYAAAIALIKQVYEVQNAGTVGESYTGSFYQAKANVHPALSDLKTLTVMTTDKAKIDYVKSHMLARVKAVIENERAKDLERQNKILFAQSIATKPDQTVIDKANEAIADINANYDAMLEVMTYRIENADYKVVKNGANENVVAQYDKVTYNGIIANGVVASFTAGVLDDNYICDSHLAFATLNLTLANAVKLSDKVTSLKKDAELLKATVEVNGATPISVEDALKEAVKEVYMVGESKDLSKIDIVTSFTDTVVHYTAHNLLGTPCTKNNVSAKAKVTLNGKSYDTVENWATTGYSEENTKAVKAIIKDAKAAIKEAKTVEEANNAFLAAYEKYDAVLTKAEQKALFSYNGPLYGKDAAAKAELNAYIDYKITLMGNDAPAGAATGAAMKAYFGITGASPISDFLEEVVDEASLQEAIAKVKATVDSLKAKSTLKAEADALVKDINSVKRLVTLAQKDEILGLWDRAMDYEDYCLMTGYPASAITMSKGTLARDVARLAGLEHFELETTKKALGAVAKLTLEQEAAVDTYVKAQDAYNDLYGKDGDYSKAITASGATPADYTAATAYEDQIFNLKVANAERLIAILPVNPTPAQVKEAKDAVDALGFAGVCAIRESLLTKLDKFTQDSKEDVAAKVQALKITASSVAKKGSITVKWTVKGDAAVADGYQIWKSTKKDSGYKKAFTTTKKSYKNTKGLKKGKRYYYKVRAYKVVDGKTVYSDWSNKANRKAK